MTIGATKPPVSDIDKQYILDIASKFGKQDVSIIVDEIKILKRSIRRSKKRNKEKYKEES